MNSLDIVFLAIIGVSVLYSFIRGLVREIFSFLAVILGFLGASYGYVVFARWLRRWVENETLAQILAFIALFILIAFLLGLMGRLLSRAVKKMDLRWADRIGGAAFGVIKAVLLIAIILLILTAFLPARSKMISDSKAAPSILAVSRGLSHLAPFKLRSLYAEKEKELRKHFAGRELSAEKAEKGGKKR